MSFATVSEQFPIAERYAYFNHAAISPLPRRAAEAMHCQIEETMRHGVHGFSQSLREHQALRDATARMLGCGADEIAITKNTSEGLLAHRQRAGLAIRRHRGRTGQRLPGQLRAVAGAAD